MKKIFKQAFADKIVRWTLIMGAIVLLAQTVYVGIFYLSLPPFLPIFNQMPWGSDRLGSRSEIFLPLVIAIAFFMLNSYLLARLYEKTPLVSRILSVTTLLITVLALIYFFQTLRVIL
jgi:hypothetical protein